MRSLGLPIGPAALSLYQLFRMPLSLIRSSDSIWIHQRGAFADGLARVERDERGDWTIVELNAVDDAARARLLARVAREVGRHGVVRLHVACAEDVATLTLLGSAGFQPYVRETLFLLKGGARSVPSPARAALAVLRPAQPSDALRIAHLMSVTTPPAVSRMELIDAREWSAAAAHGRRVRASRRSFDWRSRAPLCWMVRRARLMRGFISAWRVSEAKNTHTHCVSASSWRRRGATD